MLRRHTLFFWFSLILLFSACGKKNKLNVEFDWLLGTWQFQNSDSNMFEHWWLANDSLMLGETYLVINQEKINKEQIKLYIEGEYFVYEPMVFEQNNNLPVRFKMKSRQNNAYLFENKKHDFPHYILYKKTIPRKMIVVVGGKINGKRHTKTYKAIRMN